MATIKIGDADNIKLGSQNVLRVMLGREQVWPLTVAWVIVDTSIVVHYVNSSGQYIRAAGENTSYAYVTADILEYHGPNYHHTIYGATLTPQPFSDSLFYIDSGHSAWIRSHSLGTSPDYQQSGPSKSVSFKYGDTSNTVTATIQQQTNTKSPQSTTDVTVGFSFGVDRDWLYHSGGTINLTNTIQSYKVSTHYLWTSGAESDELNPTVNTRTHAPDTVTASPTPQSIASDKMSVTFAANNTAQDKPYIIEASLDGFLGSTQTITVRAAIYSYSHLNITSYSYNEIPASGSQNGIYPNPIVIEMDCSIDDGQPFTMTGRASNGASSATLTGNGHSVSVTVLYQRREGNYWRVDGNNGLVTATSRLNNIDSEHTTDTVSYPYRRVQATFADLESDWVSTTVYQQRNQKTLVSSSLDSYAIDVDKDNVAFSGEVVTINSYQVYYRNVYSWTSGYPNSTEYPHVTAAPTAIWTSPAVPDGNINLSRREITIPYNSGSTAIEYTIYARYTESGSYVDGSADVHQAGLTYSFATPVVTGFAYGKVDGGETYNVPASGNRNAPIYPSLHVEQTYGTGGQTSGAGTISFNVTGGARSGSVTSGGRTYTYSVDYYINNSFVTNAGLEINSRGTYDDGTDDDITVRTNCYAEVTINYKTGRSNTASVTQQANRGVPFSAYDRYDSVYINRLMDGSTEIGAILYDALTTVSVESMARWEHFFAGVEYTSGEHTGGGSEYHDEAVTPTYLYVTGGSGGYGATSFEASNAHSLSTKSYSVYFTYAGLTSSSRGFTQIADSKVTGQTKDYAATLSVTDNCWPGGGSATVIVYATHTEYSKWASDNTEVSGSETTKYDSGTVLTSGTTSGAFTISSRGSKRSDGGYPYTVTHRDMTTTLATDVLVLQGRNEAQTSATSTQYRKTVQNSLRTSGTGIPSISYGSWSLGTNYNDNYRITSFLVDDYTSSDSAASFLGATTDFTVSAAHSVLRDDTRDKYTDYYYESAYGSDYGYSDQKDANHRSRTTTTDTRTVTVTQTVTGDSVSVSYSYGASSWLSANTSTGKITISAQSTTGSARNGTIYMQNAGGGGTWPATIYQYGYASIAASVDSLNFAAGGGTKTFTITTKYATWTLSYDKPQPVSSPISEVTPESGGSLSLSSKTTTVYVTASANDGADMKIANITITGTAPGLSETITIRVSQTALSV